MTTFVPFRPSRQTPFQFNLTLDGAPYIAITQWNVFGQRYYLRVQETSGFLVVLKPLVGSKPANLNLIDVDLVGGYFKTSTLIYRPSTQNFEVSP